MPRATRDIWQGHPSTQAWKLDQLLPDRVTELHGAAWSGDIEHIKVSVNAAATLQSA